MENEIFKRKCAKGWGRDQSAHFFCEESGYKYFTLCSPGGKTEAAAAKSLQLCPTLCDPIDGSPPGPVVAGILQARTLEWVAISSSNAVKSESEVAQSCPALRGPMDCSPPGSSVHGIFQARVLEWVAIAFSKTEAIAMKKVTTKKCNNYY